MSLTRPSFRMSIRLLLVLLVFCLLVRPRLPAPRLPARRLLPVVAALVAQVWVLWAEQAERVVLVLQGFPLPHRSPRKHPPPPPPQPRWAYRPEPFRFPARPRQQ